MIELEPHRFFIKAFNPFDQFSGPVIAIIEKQGNDATGIREEPHIFSGNGNFHIELDIALGKFWFRPLPETNTPCFFD